MLRNYPSRMRRFAVPLLIAATFSAGATQASEVRYSYDAKGRLVRVEHAGGSTNGTVATYGYDAADNRAMRTVTGANPTARTNLTPVVVVPLNGFQVIVIPPDI